MTPSVGSAADVRRDHLVVAQAHTSFLLLLGALLLAVAADRLQRVPPGWGPWDSILLIAALAAAVAAMAPWLWSGCTVAAQRTITWGAIAIATFGLIGAVWVVDLLGLLGVQLVVTGGVVAELGTQRRALWWLWLCGGALVAAVLLYHGLVDLQPRPE